MAMALPLPSPDTASVDSTLATSLPVPPVPSATPPIKPFSWGPSSTVPRDVTTANKNTKHHHGTTGYTKARTLAAIMAEETEIREAALAVYPDQGKTFVEIEAEQARLWQEVASSTFSLPPPPSSVSSASRPPALEPRMEVRPTSHHHDSLGEVSSSTSSRPIESSDTHSDRLAEARNFLSEQEMEEIEKALRDEEPNVPHLPTDIVPATAAATGISTTDGVLSPAELAAIEAAVREADAREEEASVQMALALQELELGTVRHAQDRKQQHHQGNVRTMTRAELEFESLQLADVYGHLSSHPTSSTTLTMSRAWPPHPTQDDESDFDDSVGFRMNSTLAQEWARRDRNTIVGPNNEIRTISWIGGE
jgi:hypothetical protein